MRDFLYYSSLLLLGWAWYRFGQKQLQKAPFDENGAPTQGLVGPVGFLMTAGVAGYALFAVMRALTALERRLLARLPAPDRVRHGEEDGDKDREKGREET